MRTGEALFSEIVLWPQGCFSSQAVQPYADAGEVISTQPHNIRVKEPYYDQTAANVSVHQACAFPLG